MLKPGQPDQTEKNLVSLINSRNAVKCLHKASIGHGNAAITRILEEAVICGDRLIAEGQEISYKPKDGLSYLNFVRAILWLPPEKIGPLVALMKWLEIIPPDEESGKPALFGNDPGPKCGGNAPQARSSEGRKTRRRNWK
jgi:hypothetical protein